MDNRPFKARLSEASQDHISAFRSIRPTGIPSLTLIRSEMAQVIESTERTTIAYVHLASSPLIEERYGWEGQSAYIDVVSTYLKRVSSDIRGDREFSILCRAFADDYVTLFPFRGDDEHYIASMIERMTHHIRAIDSDLADLHQAYIGIATLLPFPKIHPERLLYRTIQQAQSDATNIHRQRFATQTRHLDRCLARGDDAFSIVYQPIVGADAQTIFAFEALTRCKDPELQNPHILFNVAEHAERIRPLSRIVRRLALAPIADKPEGTLLFINLHPEDLDDPCLLEPEKIIGDHAEEIVFEITERAAMQDSNQFRRNVERIRNYGARIAIDDLGSGYASLSAAVELNPDFIKLDMTLIRDIDQSTIRQNLLRNMVSFAIESGVLVIAEGIETPAELDILQNIGCHFMQGYLLARPDHHFIEALPPRTASNVQTAEQPGASHILATPPIDKGENGSEI